jgi:hypothetical protein
MLILEDRKKVTGIKKHGLYPSRSAKVALVWFCRAAERVG